MSKIIVEKIMAHAMADINRHEVEARLPDLFKRIQDGFRSSPLLAGQEGLAELAFLITGFRPRTTNQKIVPFEVFEVMSKAEQRVVKTALCMMSGNGSAYGCTSMAEGAVAFDFNTCRIADENAAAEFISREVASWDDTSVCNWINSYLGAGAYPKFFTELDRTVSSQVAKK